MRKKVSQLNRNSITRLFDYTGCHNDTMPSDEKSLVEHVRFRSSILKEETLVSTKFK